MHPHIRLGVSSCLLGEVVRFDGGHKRNAFVVETLGPVVQWVAVCPEVECRLGTPRESLRLVGQLQAPRLVATRSQQELTVAMQMYATDRVEQLPESKLHGYILKKGSPFCGMERVRVSRSNGTPQRRGRGLFAHALMQGFPMLPVEEEGRLNDRGLRENFVERIYAYARWCELIDSEPSPGDLVRFHTRSKMLLLAHSRPHYQRLGRLVSQAGTLAIAELLSTYGEVYMAALAVPATPKKHTNVLHHLLGHLKTQLDTDDKQECLECIESYRQEQVPLMVPLTLLRHHFRRHPVAWVLEQSYLDPYPFTLMPQSS